MALPAAPTIYLIAFEDSKFVVAFTPASSVTPAITSYEYQTAGNESFSSPGPVVNIGLTTNPFTITGLTNGVVRYVRIRAVNSEGAGPWSFVSGAIPTATNYTNVARLSPDTNTAQVTFTSSIAPWTPSNPLFGGLRFYTDTGYTQYYYPSTTTQQSPLVYTADGLMQANGLRWVVGYIDVIGYGAFPIASQVAAAAPTVPQAITAVPGDSTLTVTYSAPTADGGSPVTSYEYSLNSGLTVISVGLLNPFQITDLTNGAAYSVVLRAVNAVGPSAWSAPVTSAPNPKYRAYAVGDRTVRIIFDGALPAPMHVSSTATGDALNPRTWNVLQTYEDTSGGRVMTCMSVRAINAHTYDLLLLEPFEREGSKVGFYNPDGSYFSGVVSASANINGNLIYEDSSSEFINVNFDIAIASANASNTANAVSKGYALRDIANVSISAPGTLENELYSEFIGGTLVPNSSGDYAGMSGEALLRKLIVRRLISSNGDFFHLPGYGAGISIKGVFSTANLPILAKDIERQVLLEPDVERAKVTLTYQAANSILIVQVQARMRSTGQQTGLSLSLPLGGTKSF